MTIIVISADPVPVAPRHLIKQAIPTEDLQSPVRQRCLVRVRSTPQLQRICEEDEEVETTAAMPNEPIGHLPLQNLHHKASTVSFEDSSSCVHMASASGDDDPVEVSKTSGSRLGFVHGTSQF